MALTAGLVSLLMALVVAILVAVRWHPLVAADRHVDINASATVGAHRWLLDAARSLTHFGDPAVVTTVAIVLAGLSWAVGRRRAAVYLVAVRGLAVVIDTGMKDLVRRVRPALTHPVAHAAGFSFPSGHAVGAAACYASVALAMGLAAPRWARLLLAVVPPLVVAATRVLLGVHFPSDVVGGLAVGWGIALLATPVLPREWTQGCPSIARDPQ